MSSGEWLTRITAWLAFALWIVAVAQMQCGGPTKRERGVGFIWLAGSVVMLIHVALAFQFHHQWSHEAAIIETARQTAEVTGMNWGGGVWLNYLFATVWLSDACWRVARPNSYMSRARWSGAGIHMFLTFIWFNATVVFGSRAMQIVGAAAFGWLAIQAWKRAIGRRSGSSS
jgi:hypothetical protein